MEQKQKAGEARKMERKPISVEEANSRAYQEALAEECTITLEKKPGSALFHRTIKASSAPAALNGIACLIREYASITGKTPIQILFAAVLAVLAAAALFAALAATEPVIVVTKEAEQGLQPVVLIVPEAEV
ncbi:MAG: hypothetical protein KH108_14525 [Faecalibacterium prausnitzii]|nr:hypothetical protein [Faecalibacterium prausnitzii]